jgi:hypothetical protein
VDELKVGLIVKTLLFKFPAKSLIVYNPTSFQKCFGHSNSDKSNSDLFVLHLE